MSEAPQRLGAAELKAIRNEVDFDLGYSEGVHLPCTRQAGKLLAHIDALEAEHSALEDEYADSQMLWAKERYRLEAELADYRAIPQKCWACLGVPEREHTKEIGCHQGPWLCKHGNSIPAQWGVCICPEHYPTEQTQSTLNSDSERSGGSDGD